MAASAAAPLPDGVSQHIDEIIRGEGFTYHVDYRHERSAIREEDTERIQIRAETTPDKQHVRKLAEAIRAGAKMDLICVTRDGFRVYGKHRFEAFKVLGTTLIPVIVIDIDAAEADDDVLRRLQVVGIRENAHHGLRNSKQTDEMAVVIFRADGWDNGSIARELGVPGSRVGEILAHDKGKKALEALGIPVNALNKTAVAALGRAAEDLNRGPFQELAHLAADASMNKTEINALAKAAKGANDDVDAVALVTAERQRLASRATGSGPRPSFAAQLRQRLGFIAGKSSTPEVFVEANLANRDEHLRLVEESIAVLTAVRDLMVADEEDAA